MKTLFSTRFKKQYKKLRLAEQKKFDAVLDLFEIDATNPVLNNHWLQGKYRGCRSINVTGDIRAIYQPIAEDMAYFIAIGTHSKLYSE
jgi:addiction module RelE/StbE family toxin